jgi:outer membrane protein OmpA-like peptidoglycan-associated protein
MVPFLIERKALLLVFSVPVVLGLQGCLATRGWVTEQMIPLSDRVSAVETRLGQTEAKADEALARLDNLRLEKRFVLDLKEGANFSMNSGALTADAKSQIDGFLSDLKETDDAIFLVAGHTDSMGPESYNYELGQKRAASVARYIMNHRGIDPLRVTTVSYGEDSPLAENTSAEGRRKNRRVEILVYKEAITSAPGRSDPRAEVEDRGGRVTAYRGE